MDYKQAKTTEIINRLRSAERKTSASYLRDALSAGHQRLSEMDSLVLRLISEHETLRADNERLSKMVDDLEAQRGAHKRFDYNKFVRDFYKSGKSMMRMRIKKLITDNGDVWFSPSSSKVRLAASRLNLPIDAQQRTGGGDDVPPILIMYRTDDIDGEVQE